MAERRDVEDTQENRLIKFGMRLGVSAALHPFEYSKVLIQVRQTYSLDFEESIDKSTLALTNIHMTFILLSLP